VEHKFPEPGHSFLDSDRDFGHVEVAAKRRENIYTLDEYCNIMAHSSTKPKPVVTRMGDKMCNVQQLPAMLGLKKKISTQWEKKWNFEIK